MNKKCYTKKQMIKVCLIFSFLIVVFCGIKIYGASISAYVHGLVNLGAHEENGKLVFTTDGLKLDSDYTSENTIALSNGDVKFEMYLITDRQYKNRWDWAKQNNCAKLMAQRTFTKNSSNNYERKNDLSGTYTVTDTAVMKKILEIKSIPKLGGVSPHSDGIKFSIDAANENGILNIQNFYFNYYYFYTQGTGYLIGSHSLSIDYNVMYSVNGGEWKCNTTAGTTGSVFNYSDFKPGDVVKIKLVDSLGMGYESNTVETKIYGLTVDPNGGTWNNSTSGQTFAMINGNKKDIAVPTRKGYAFTGWTLSGTGSKMTSLTETSTFTMGTANATLKATWEQNTFTLTINPNGGSMNNGSTVTKSAFTTDFVYGRKTYIGNICSDGTYYFNTPTREGYTFTGWKFSNGTGGINTSGSKFYFSDTTIYGTNANIYIFNGDYKGSVTATAQWEKNTYTLTINPNGGSMNNGSTVTKSAFTTDFIYGRKTYIGNLNSDGTFCASNVPTREGYLFTGWSFSNGTGGQNTSGDTYYFSSTSSYASSTNTYIFNGDYKGDITVTAQWKDNTPPEWTTKDPSGKKVSGGLYINPSSWTNGSAIISASAQDSGSGMSSVKIYNSSNKELATGVSSASYTQSTEGIIYYYAVATDKAGNKAITDKKAVYIDKTPPIITAGTTSSGWTNEDIRLTVTATDALSGVQKVEIYTASGSLVASGKTEASYIITEPTNEEYVIKATDVAGNTTEKKQSIQLDKENSKVIIDDGTDTPAEFKPGAAVESHVIGWVNKDVPLKVIAADSLSGIKSIELKDHYGNVIKSNNKELQYTFTNEGISHYTIIVTDNAGNTKTINLTVKIDKTPPEIIGDEEVKDPNYGLIEHQAVDSMSGIKSFKLYYYDTMQEVIEDEGLIYKEDNTISFKSMNTFNLYWKLIAEDKAGNITEMTVHTPYNFKISVEADNLRTETENFLIGSDAQLKITLWGYVDTVEVKFERTLENAAEKEEYTLDRLIESGDAFIRIPEKNDYVEYTFKLPEGVDPREYRIWVYGYRDGWKRTEYVDINLITYEQLCKEQVHKFKRVIKSSTWHRVEER